MATQLRLHGIRRAVVVDHRASARDALAGRARAHLEARFSLDRMVSETLDLYVALLGRDR